MGVSLIMLSSFNKSSNWNLKQIVSIFLSQARRLRENPAMANIYISQLLSREEIERVKALRRHCESLNKSAVGDKKGRKRFVVLSGKFMFRADSGKLEPYYDKTADSSTLISSDVGTKVNLATETKN